MSNFEFVDGGVCAAKGYKASGTYSGIRRNPNKDDMSMIVSEVPANAAAVFTKNKVKAAHIKVMKRHLSDHTAQAVVVNSGNANTCTANGEEIAEFACSKAAKALSIRPADVMPASTGVIGVPLTEDPFEKGIPSLTSKLRNNGSGEAARAIMTTDTLPKELAVRFEIGGKECTIGGIAKGSGMIHINMGTMLSFLCSDAAISKELLEKALREEVPDSFNQISVDGDTSTNDTLLIMANGLAGNPEITEEGEDYRIFTEALHGLCTEFARKIAGDGEGATKLMEVHVSGAPSKEIARKVSKQVVSSTLLKAAIYGEDANWGRVLCAVGYTDADFSCDHVEVSIGSKSGAILVCRESAAVPFSEEEASKILAEEHVIISVDLHDGSKEASAYGCDLTHEYVSINGDYRS
ncbi:MAG: bifunctional glutamate N-acetyltransferase/amino-acid acetyltransferase ArgJ [Eubacteriales bacterium]|nr:bifunctional glutamate N-acetyltransferase/amino-acid acetyltransferase ArgJ [Eubacteriales bacterium]